MENTQHFYDCELPKKKRKNTQRRNHELQTQIQTQKKKEDDSLFRSVIESKGKEHWSYEWVLCLNKANLCNMAHINIILDSKMPHNKTQILQQNYNDNKVSFFEELTKDALHEMFDRITIYKYKMPPLQPNVTNDNKNNNNMDNSNHNENILQPMFQHIIKPYACGILNINLSFENNDHNQINQQKMDANDNDNDNNSVEMKDNEITETISNNLQQNTEQTLEFYFLINCPYLSDITESTINWFV